MALTPGNPIGPYEATGSLGAGGMAELHHTRDTSVKGPLSVERGSYYVVRGFGAHRSSASEPETVRKRRGAADLSAVTRTVSPTYLHEGSSTWWCPRRSPSLPG